MAKILIVDDSSFQRRLVRRLLCELGHEVIEAEDGSKGLDAFHAEAPDLLLVDLLMPGLTGYDVLERLHEERTPVPRVVLTADIQMSAKQRCLDLGAAGVLSKPPSREALSDAVENALAGVGS